MAEIINLNRARKQAVRAKDKKQAEANRLTFGRTKAERILTEKEKASAIQHIDGHKLTED